MRALMLLTRSCHERTRIVMVPPVPALTNMCCTTPELLLVGGVAMDPCILRTGGVAPTTEVIHVPDRASQSFLDGHYVL